jgi:uncharacterized protein YjiS (DUF1127 family)
MRRREFITLIGSASVAWPRAALAQQPGRVRRIGVLMSVAETDPASQSEVAAFRGALSNLGWTEGDNVRIELRWGAGDADKIRTLAKELVDLRPDAILGRNTPVIAALARAIARRVGATENRAHSRHELLNLSDRTLRDIGVAHCDAGIEGPKSFWVPS